MSNAASPPGIVQPTPNITPPGWYLNTQGASQYWNGSQWAAPPTAPRGPGKKVPLWAFVVTVIGTLILGISFGNAVHAGDAAKISALTTKVDILQAKVDAAPRASLATDTTSTPTEPSPAAPLTLAGDGEGNSQQVDLAGDYAVAWSTGGDRYYSGDLEGGGSFPPQVFTADAAIGGTNNLYDIAAGTYYIQVITGPAPSCPWSVTLTPLP